MYTVDAKLELTGSTVLVAMLVESRCSPSLTESLPLQNAAAVESLLSSLLSSEILARLYSRLCIRFESNFERPAESAPNSYIPRFTHTHLFLMASPFLMPTHSAHGRLWTAYTAVDYTAVGIRRIAETSEWPASG